MKSGGQNSQIISHTEDKIRIGIKLRESGKFVEAKDQFISIIEKSPKYSPAYIELYNTYNDTTANDIINTFSSFRDEAPAIAKLLEANLHLRIGEIDKAKEVNNLILKENPNKAIFVKAMLNNFYISLYNENKKEEAKKILADVISQSSLTTELELSLARHALNTFVPMELEDRQQLKKQVTNKTISVPLQFELYQNYPNPFNPTTTIAFSIPKSNDVQLTVYDYLGRTVVTLIDGYTSEGKHEVIFDASKLSSGIYFYKIVSGTNIATKKLLLLK